MDNTPLKTWTYFWLQVLYSIPVVGFIFLIIHAIGANNINKRNFARSHFCIFVVILVLGIICFFIVGGPQLITNFKDFIAQQAGTVVK